MGKEIVSSIRGNSSSEEKENGTHFPTFPFAIFHGVGVAAFDPRWAELICISIQLDAHTTLLHRCIIASIGIKQWKRIFLHFSISPFLFFSLFFFCLVFVFLCFRTDHHVTRKWMDNREWISRLRHRSGERRGREGGRKGGKGGGGGGREEVAWYLPCSTRRSNKRGNDEYQCYRWISIIRPLYRFEFVRFLSWLIIGRQCGAVIGRLIAQTPGLIYNRSPDVTQLFPTRFRAHFEHFSSKFRAVSDQFPSSSRAVFEQFSSSFRPFFEQFWSNFGTILEQFWSNFGAILEHFPSSFWAFSEQFPSRFRAVSEPFPSGLPAHWFQKGQLKHVQSFLPSWRFH